MEAVGDSEKHKLQKKSRNKEQRQWAEHRPLDISHLLDELGKGPEKNNGWTGGKEA
jgi:hypothetical protein